MASLIIGASIFAAIHIKERKAKKIEVARKAEEARYAELHARQSSLKTLYPGNGVDNSSFVALPTYSVSPPTYNAASRTRSSSIYSQDSASAGRETERGHA